MDEYIFLFSPGNCSYISQLARYCSDVKLIKKNNEIHIINNNCKPIITNNYECVKYAEIITDLDSFILQLIGKIYCDMKDYLTNTKSNGAIYIINPTKLNLGQGLDLEQIHKTYQKIISNNKDAKIICFGVSRGVQLQLIF